MKKAYLLLWQAVLMLLFGMGSVQAIQRVVSLDLCTDWMLARYAAREQVAALSPMNRQYPVAWVEQDWPMHDGSLEQILQIHPDLVITGEYNALLLRERLKGLGVRVEILPLPRSLADILVYEQRLLNLLALPLELSSAPPARLLSPKPRKRLLLLGANGVGTGQGTFEDEILKYAGWDNYLHDEGHLRLDLEQIVAHPPDAILWAAPASHALANRFASHPVLREVVSQSHWLMTDYWRWQCPGPWTWDLIRQLSQWND